ncbi:hypothetical protein CBS101457_004006 [Exobasidium rhododendri]|nr:hypothetical protein CBS101457_004006 [Exobasidium rhododendri]
MEDSYVIIGAGVFGSSTALELVKAGHQVTVLERSKDGYHSIDAASNDLNKIIRADYSDEHYRNVGKAVISMWRRSPLLSPYYHEVGVLFYGEGEDASASRRYVREGVSRAVGHEIRESKLELARKGEKLPSVAHAISSKEEFLRSLPPSMHTKVGKWAARVEAGTATSYFNPRGGWGEADRATRAVLDEAKRLGAQVYGESQVVKLLFDSSLQPTKVVGVKTSNGREYKVSGKGHVILCAGAWAQGLLHDLVPKQWQLQRMPTWPSAQCVVALQLNEEQRTAYAKAPVVLDFTTGFYCFEPDSEGVMKIAIHSNGYQNPAPSRSNTSPNSFPSFHAGEEGGGASTRPEESTSSIPSSRSEEYIPSDKLESMLSQLGKIYPDLENATVKYTRVCFYSDSEDENWIIDHFPGIQNLVVASGDSGHAFKFLPMLGSLVCARLGLPSVAALTPHQSHVFSFAYHTGRPPSQQESDNAKLANTSLVPAKLRFRL